MSQKKIGELFDFTGKTVVVTGGANGIGYGIARRFAEAGANVVISDINKEAGEAKAESLGTEFGGKTLFVKTDVSSEEDVKTLVAKTREAFGSLDIMINNAGIFPTSTVLSMEVGFWDKVQAVNGRGVFLGCREAAKAMIEQGSGTIINIASIDALHPSMVGLAAYDNSKHGVCGFTKNLALELAPHKIRVNAIAPGGVSTEGVAAMSEGGATVSDEQMKAFLNAIPMGRYAEPDEMATVALFLASDAASYLTGSIIVADGGSLIA